MEEFEQIFFELISYSGESRSCYLEAIDAACNKNYELSDSLFEQGNKAYIEAHKVHAKLLQKEANHEQIDCSLLLIHSQDLMMSAEMFGTLAEKFIDLNRKIDKVQSDD